MLQYLGSAAHHLDRLRFDCQYGDWIEAANAAFHPSLSGLVFTQLSSLEFEFDDWWVQASPSDAHTGHNLRSVRGALYWQNALTFLRNNHFPALQRLDIYCAVGSYASVMELALSIKAADAPGLTEMYLEIMLPPAVRGKAEKILPRSYNEDAAK